ncbi:transposon Tf2-9 polyprotein [Trichonephila clavipes]|nr:transposon Tf2-9 polyprotein [Trichonephila clavipes]
MQHVEALSRYPVTIITSDTLTARLQRAQQEDENIQNLKSLIGTNNATDFFIKNEILYKYVDRRELIAAPRDMQTELIKQNEQLIRPRQTTFIPRPHSSVMPNFKKISNLRLNNLPNPHAHNFASEDLNQTPKQKPLYHASLQGLSCNLSYRSIAARVDQDSMTVRRIWNRWVQDCNTVLDFNGYLSPAA